MDTPDRIFEPADKKYSEQRDLAVEMDIAPSVASVWRNKKSESYMKHSPQIAEILGTAVEYLLTGKEEKPAPAPAPDFLIKFNSLTPESQKEVIVFIEFKYGQGSQSQILFLGRFRIAYLLTTGQLVVKSQSHFFRLSTLFSQFYPSSARLTISKSQFYLFYSGGDPDGYCEKDISIIR